MKVPQRPVSMFKTRLTLLLIGGAVAGLLPDFPARTRVILLAGAYFLALMIERVVERKVRRQTPARWPTFVMGTVAILAIHWTGSIHSPLLLSLAAVILDGLRAGFGRGELSIVVLGLSVGLAMSSYLTLGTRGLQDPALWMEVGVLAIVSIFAAELVDTLKSNLRRSWTAARRDALTGLPNRRAFDEDYSTCLAAWRRNQTPFAILVADLDRTKDINDRFGHLEGDRYLKRAADLLRRAVRSDDRVYRYGGDEFAIILSGTDELAMPRVVDRIQQLVGDEQSAGTMVLSVSLGWASSTQVGGDQVLSVADAAMYADKRTRRREPRVT